MKKLILLTFIGLITIFKISAKKIEVEGQIIYKNNKKVNVIIRVHTSNIANNLLYSALQDEIIYFNVDTKKQNEIIHYNTKKGKKKKLKPEDAKEVRFIFKNENIRILPLKFSNKSIFLKLRVDGYLKLFDYYSDERFILQKGKALTIITEFKFRQTMIEYFSDCPGLAEQIKRRKFKKKDIEEIVIYYNLKCASKFKKKNRRKKY